MKSQILLTRPHTHAGRLRQPGERIEVDADLASWLVSLGSARSLPPARSTRPRITPPCAAQTPNKESHP